MPWFELEQNATRNTWLPPAQYLYIEAETAEEAEKRAEALGVGYEAPDPYYCECCGARWSGLCTMDEAHADIEAVAQRAAWWGPQRSERSPRGEPVPAFALLPLAAEDWQVMPEGWPEVRA